MIRRRVFLVSWTKRDGGEVYPANNIDLGDGVSIRSLQIDIFSYASFKPGNSGTSALTIADGGKVVAYDRFDADLTLGTAAASEIQLGTFRGNLTFTGNIAEGMGAPRETNN